MLTKTIAKNRIRELRARLGLRQSDLAHEVGVSRQSIISIERCRLNPSVLLALRIARVLREPLDYVFFLASDDAEEPPVSSAHASPRVTAMPPVGAALEAVSAEELAVSTAGTEVGRVVLAEDGGVSVPGEIPPGKEIQEALPGHVIWDFPEN